MDTARDCYYALRELVIRHPGGRAGETVLATLRKLCRLADKAAADAECSERLAAVEGCGAELFSGCASGNGVRRRILAELEEFRARLHVLEVTKKAA